MDEGVEWRILHFKELCELHRPFRIVTTVKSRMRGHVAHLGQGRNAYRNWETCRKDIAFKADKMEG
jgi:hypothetical protein